MNTEIKENKISSPVGLQINNIVYNKHGEYHIIGCNDFSRFKHPDMGGDYGLYGIPLSPEILEKCGFIIDIIDREKYYELQISETEKFLWTNGVLNFGIMGVAQYQWYNSLNIEYLHQLMNMHYALTQTELPVKL